VSDGNGIEVRGVTGSVIIANNAVYSETGTAIRLISGNLSLVTLAGNVGSARSLERARVMRTATELLPISSRPITTELHRSTCFRKLEARSLAPPRLNT